MLLGNPNFHDDVGLLEKFRVDPMETMKCLHRSHGHWANKSEDHWTPLDILVRN